MFEAVASPYLVPFDGTFRIERAPTSPPDDAPGKGEAGKLLAKRVAALRDLQRVLYADGRHAVLLVFQAMDGGGKDSTIRAVLTGVNPAGCRVVSFKQPTAEELQHHFLWRTTRRLPERGEIGVFNRSHYEEVLVVRIHPELLEAQRLRPRTDLDALWQERYAMIRNHEEDLARNGTVVVKFWLNLSNAEQRRRFLSRVDRPEKNWKFSEGDIRERERWPDYMRAYEEAVRATSRPWAPWYAIPADSKAFMRLTVADIVVRSLEQLELRFPRLDDDARERLLACAELLREERL